MYDVKNWYKLHIWLLETGLSQNSSTFLLNLGGKTHLYNCNAQIFYEERRSDIVFNSLA